MRSGRTQGRSATITLIHIGLTLCACGRCGRKEIRRVGQALRICCSSRCGALRIRVCSSGRKGWGQLITSSARVSSLTFHSCFIFPFYCNSGLQARSLEAQHVQSNGGAISTSTTTTTTSPTTYSSGKIKPSLTPYSSSTLVGSSASG